MEPKSNSEIKPEAGPSLPASPGSAICDCCGKTSARAAIILSETLAGVAMCRECALEDAVAAAMELLPSNWQEHSGFLRELGTKMERALAWPNG